MLRRMSIDPALAGGVVAVIGDSTFLHMGMHLAIREQVSTDRPPGIRDLYRQLSLRCTDEHQLQHQLMECLAEMLWQAQRDDTVPDEARYLDCIRALAADR